MADENLDGFNLWVFYGGVNCFNQCVNDYSSEIPDQTEKECFKACATQINELFNQIPPLNYQNLSLND